MTRPPTVTELQLGIENPRRRDEIIEACQKSEGPSIFARDRNLRFYYEKKVMEAAVKLRAEGWTLQRVGDLFGWSRERTRQRIARWS